MAAQLLSLLPFTFGLATTSIIARLAPQYLTQVDYTGGLIAIAPPQFFLPLLLLAMISGLSTGTTSLRCIGTGLRSPSIRYP